VEAAFTSGQQRLGRLEPRPRLSSDRHLRSIGCQPPPPSSSSPGKLRRSSLTWAHTRLSLTLATDDALTLLMLSSFLSSPSRQRRGVCDQAVRSLAKGRGLDQQCPRPIASCRSFPQLSIPRIFAGSSLFRNRISSLYCILDSGSAACLHCCAGLFTCFSKHKDSPRASLLHRCTCHPSIPLPQAGMRFIYHCTATL
jgi:hypothetical protein